MINDNSKQQKTLSGRGGFKGGIKPKTENPLNQVNIRLTEEHKKILKNVLTVKFLREILDFCKIEKNLKALKDFIKSDKK